jgi:hydrogenase maturation protease
LRPEILIAGVGNIFCGDDGFGCEVIRQLNTRPWPEHVHIRDFGTRSFDLAFALLDTYDRVILVDAATRGSSPGSLYLIEPEVEAHLTADAHSMDLGKTLRLARSMGATVGRVIIVGCEPASLTPTENSDTLSDIVQASVPLAIDMIETLVMETCTNYQSL